MKIEFKEMMTFDSLTVTTHIVQNTVILLVVEPYILAL
jgi:hypothetical protein